MQPASKSIDKTDTASTSVRPNRFFGFEGFVALNISISWFMYLALLNHSLTNLTNDTSISALVRRMHREPGWRHQAGAFPRCQTQRIGAFTVKPGSFI